MYGTVTASETGAAVSQQSIHSVVCVDSNIWWTARAIVLLNRIEMKTKYETNSVLHCKGGDRCDCGRKLVLSIKDNAGHTLVSFMLQHTLKGHSL